MYRLGLLLALGACVAGCNDTVGAVLADVQWTLTCDPGPGETCQGLSDTPTCLGTGSRRVNQFDSATVCDGDLVRTTCRGVRSESSINLDLGVTVADNNYRFEVDRLNVDDSGAILPSPTCQIQIAEDELDYAGACGAAAPSAPQPCQVSNAVIAGSTVDVEVFCDRLPSVIGADDVANVRGPGADGGATLHFENCEGL